MTEITREHLELAALAAGKRGAMAAIGRNEFDAIDADTLTVWRPHTDIADAARLAVRCCLMTDTDSAYSCMATDAVETIRVRHYGTQPDKERAYCESITLCAAEIGRRMKGGA